MSYHGYIAYCKQFLHGLKHPPKMLEVGVDTGATYLSIVTFLARTRPEFFAVGVDILVQEAPKIQLANLDLQPNQQAFLSMGNSLELLPLMINQGMKFDLVLLDGDHNYYTVSKELESIQSLVHDHSMIVVDDYAGRWGNSDLFYSERQTHKDVKIATQKIDTEKHGVQPAVDEWLEKNPSWKKQVIMQGEPVVLIKS